MKKLYIAVLYFALLVLAACGENWYGNSPSGGSDIKSMRSDAESAFRKGDYKGSYTLCSLIVVKEPSSSFGYFGMAKAGLWQYGVSPLSVFSIIKPLEGECPFMGEDIKVRNNYLQAMRKIFNALSELDRRDSLTALYEFHVRAKKDKGWARDTIFDVTIDNQQERQTLDERLSDFRKTFCGNSPSNDCNDTTSGKRKPFPLSDREYKNSYFGGILLLSSFSKWFLDFFDTNKDSCLTRSPGVGRIPGIDYPSSTAEWKKWGCVGTNGLNSKDFDLSISLKCPRDSITGEMSVVVDSKQILDDLNEDMQEYYECVYKCTKNCDTECKQEQIGDFNNKLDDFGDSFEDVSNILDGMGLGGSGDPDIDQGSLKDEIDKYKAYSSFYKMGTHFDEDGDGCIDEELLDGQDNDGDGFANENARLSPTDPNDKYYGISPMNNSMFGNNRYRDNTNWEYNKPVYFNQPVKICNAPDCSIFTMLPLNEEGWVTVINFTQKAYPDGKKYWTTNNADLKLRIVQDKDCSKYKLQDRINLIGGCWPWYSQQQFDEYCETNRSRP